MKEDEIAAAWLEAIHRATICLRQPRNYMENNNDDDDINNNNTNRHQLRAEQEAHEALTQLHMLEQQLRQKERYWDRLPNKLPVERQQQQQQQQNSAAQQPLENAAFSSEFRNRQRRQGSFSKKNNQNKTLSNMNPFAALNQGSDDESYENDSEYDEVDEDLAEAGDLPTALVRGMVMRRLMIRIVAYQSDLGAFLSQICRKTRPVPQWKRGAEYCTTALQKIHEAIDLADSEISRLLLSLTHNHHHHNNNINSSVVRDLMEDADVVSVAVRSLTDENDRFRREAQRQKNRLERRLQPQWESRDEVRRQMGDRWYQNPRPRNEHAQRRRQDEQELREIELALAELENMDQEMLVASSEELRRRILSSGETGAASQRQLQRYNGIRPTDLSRRVPFGDYPDPTEFGWTFTGSIPTCEFFEIDNGGIKLDWYFTTGTIKTSLDHPTQGKTQLFGARVDPNLYRRILINPREHTNVRYHVKTTKKKSKTTAHGAQQRNRTDNNHPSGAGQRNHG